MKALFKLSTVALLLAALPAAASTIPITSTGGEAEGTIDTDWSINGGAAYVTTTGGFPFPAWFANDGGSSWISPQASYAGGQTDPGNGAFTYTTTFDLTGLLPGTASIDFFVAVDNTLADVQINGASTGYAYAGFSTFSGSFNISSGFVAGLNTLSFLTTNALGDTGNPAGLRVLFSSATADDAPSTPDVPEPGSLTLLGIGVALLAARRRRQTL